MLCQNTSNKPARIKIDTLPGRPPMVMVVPPGTKVEVPDGYCVPVQARGGRIMQPIITRLCASMKPLPGEYSPGYSAETYGRQAEAAAAGGAQAQAVLNDALAGIRAEMQAFRNDVSAELEDKDAEIARLRDELDAARAAHVAATGPGSEPVSVGRLDADAFLDELGQPDESASDDPPTDLAAPVDRGKVSPPITAEELEAVHSGALTRRALIAIASTMGIKGISAMNKAQLTEAILAAYSPPPAPPVLDIPSGAVA